jgi:hypothetical protein
MFTCTFACNVLKRRHVVYLGEKMLKLAFGGLRWDVILENNPDDGFVCREFVHNNHNHTPPFSSKHQHTKHLIIFYWGNILMSSWHY